MRKLTVLAMAAIMAVSMSSVVFASEVNNGSKDVTATYKAGAVSDIIYSVDVSWGSMEFTYTSPAQGTWNPETHAYDGAETTGRWSCGTDANKITVTNHSNTDITADLSYNKGVDYQDIVGTFSSDVLSVASAVDTPVEQAPSASAILEMAGELPESEESVVVGSITITLDKNE